MNGAADVTTKYEPLPWADSGRYVEDRGAGAPWTVGHSTPLHRQCRLSRLKCGYGLQLGHGAPLCVRGCAERIDGEWVPVGDSAQNIARFGRRRAQE